MMILIYILIHLQNDNFRIIQIFYPNEVSTFLLIPITSFHVFISSLHVIYQRKNVTEPLSIGIEYNMYYKYYL